MRKCILPDVWIGVRSKNGQNQHNPENRFHWYSTGANDFAGYFAAMSNDSCPDRKIDFSPSLPALLSDDSVRIFSPETFAVGATLCLSTWAVLFWMGVFSFR